MLPEKQSQILEYIKDYQLENGSSPTFGEIREYFNFSSLNSVFKHLKALEVKGFIRKSNQARGIELLDEVRENLFEKKDDKVPLFGSVPAGDPTTMEGNIIDEINVSEQLLPKKDGIFLLKVTGDSMDQTGIIEGDIVIVDSTKKPKNFDIVVALVDNANTLKRYMLKDGLPHLMPESSNPRHSEIIPVNEAYIQGVVTASFRNY